MISIHSSQVFVPKVNTNVKDGAQFCYSLMND